MRSAARLGVWLVLAVPAASMGQTRAPSALRNAASGHPRPLEADAVSAPEANGVQIITGWMGSVLVGFLAWRAFDEPNGHHSRVVDDWGYTPRAHSALIIGSFVGGTLGVWLKGRDHRATSLLTSAAGVALPTLPLLARRDDPLLPFMLALAFAPLQGFVGYAGYRVSAHVAGGIVADTARVVARAPAAPRRNDDLILADEIRKTAAVNVYDAIAQLRQHWLSSARMRSPVAIEGAGEPGTLVVYVEGVRYGDVESLRQLSISGVQEIRYFNARDATSRFGTGHPAGAIVVTIAAPR